MTSEFVELHNKIGQTGTAWGILAVGGEPETVGQRVKKAREAAGISQRKLAKLIGTSQQAIGDLETKESGGSTHLVAIAAALGVTAEYLYGGNVAGPTNLPSTTKEIGLTPLAHEAPVIGSAAVGLWRETSLTPLPLSQKTETIPYLPTKSHAGLPQYGLRVEGPSMDKVVKPGEFVAIVLVSDGAPYVPNDIVVVERRKGELFEITLKRLTRLTEDAAVLEPESDQDGYTPLIMRREGDEECRIVGVAIGKYAPF